MGVEYLDIGSYFNPPYFEEHVVCEYWNAAEARWVLVDPQFDEVWRAELKIDHDVLDVPCDRFVIAGESWVQCRGGDASPAKFGIFKGDLLRLWFIAGEMVRDVAALNKMEMLPWDVWGAIPAPTSRSTMVSLRFSAGLPHSRERLIPHSLNYVHSMKTSACAYLQSSSIRC